MFDCYLGCTRCNIELAFLLDASSKRHYNEWVQMRVFVQEVVKQYNISQNCVRFAVIRYNDTYADVQYQLKRNTDVRSFLNFAYLIRCLRGGSNLALALDLLRTQAFASDVVRPNAARIAIVVTDQIQSSQLISNAADIVRSQGITIVGVGITGPGRVDINFLSSITSNRRAIQVGNHSQLVSGAKDRVVRELACFPPETPPVADPSMFLFSIVHSIRCSVSLCCEIVNNVNHQYYVKQLQTSLIQLADISSIKM